jgi:hypothetical protein
MVIMTPAKTTAPSKEALIGILIFVEFNMKPASLLLCNWEGCICFPVLFVVVFGSLFEDSSSLAIQCMHHHIIT